MRRFSSTALLVLGLAVVCEAQSVAWLDRIFDKKEFKSKSFGPARWLEKGEAYTTVEGPEDEKDLVRYNTANGIREIIAAASKLIPKGEKKPLKIEDYAWSKDSKQLLIFTNTKKVWRLNTRGDYWVWNRETGSLRKLGGSASQTLMFAKFSPDGKQAAYVRANNILVEDIATGDIRQLTTDGSNAIINGTSDWVYEEEFAVRDGFRWSPDGKSIAYWQFDTTGIGQFPLVNNTDSVYPVIQWLPYPKTGTKNSAPRIGIVDVAASTTRWLNIPGDPRENYIARMDWAENSNEVAVQFLNRKQQTNDLLLGDVRSGEVQRVFRDEDEAWVDVDDDMEWIAEGKSFSWASERDGWRRVYVVSRDGSSVRAISPSGVDVEKFVRIDGDQKWLYYIASPDDATRRYLFRAPMGGGAAEKLTPANQPGWHTYDVSPNGQWAFHTYSNFNLPPRTELVRMPSHQLVRALEENASFVKAVQPLLRSKVEFLQVTTEDNISMDGWLIKPPGFDAKKKYPLLIYVYGEPAAVTVTDHWGGDRELFHRVMAEQGYIIASFDNRGTPAPKGRAWRKVVYGKVGVHSSIDQAAALKVLLKTRSYLDPNRVAVWGWSGGGSNTLNLMFRHSGLYKTGMSVAPVPDQKLYDTIYQERYMGTPEGNPEGYLAGSSIHFATGLKGNLLIVHGSGDDNVHYQGTEKLINRLIQLGKSFDMMEYPNRSHSISEGDGTTMHLYKLLARYLMQHVPPGPLASR